MQVAHLCRDTFATATGSRTSLRKFLKIRKHHTRNKPPRHISTDKVVTLECSIISQTPRRPVITHHVAVRQRQIVLVELIRHLRRRGGDIRSDVVDEFRAHCPGKAVKLIEKGRESE